ncbi:Os07g0464400 [Oryza sativa Japonica Group]|uniref:Os07g0464400 protein n=1 Tax=Oryza sativa subsp. japonica TaxID=39947 RepID=A0A0P0X5P1_ORYSJ|nr:Os07g0464400 [Oryza sativa Japonica Group]
MACRWNGRISSGKRSRLSTDISMMSLMSMETTLSVRAMVSMTSLCSGTRVSSYTMDTRPRMEWIGRRSPWLITPCNACLASFAMSASRCAYSSSRFCSASRTRIARDPSSRVACDSATATWPATTSMISISCCPQLLPLGGTSTSTA